MIELPKRFVSKTVAANQHAPGREGSIRLTPYPGEHHRYRGVLSTVIPSTLASERLGYGVLDARIRSR